MTESADPAANRAWWARREIGTYVPACTLVNGALRFAR